MFILYGMITLGSALFVKYYVKIPTLGWLIGMITGAVITVLWGQG